MSLLVGFTLFWNGKSWQMSSQRQGERWFVTQEIPPERARAMLDLADPWLSKCPACPVPCAKCVTVKGERRTTIEAALELATQTREALTAQMKDEEL